MTQSLVLPKQPTRNIISLIEWNRQAVAALQAASAAGQTIKILHEQNGSVAVEVEANPTARTITFTCPGADAPYVWDANTSAGDPDTPENAYKSALYHALDAAQLLIVLPQELPAYAAHFESDGLHITRQGADYALLSIRPTMTFSTNSYTWRGPINGKPWTTDLPGARYIIDALVKREKIHAPVYGFRDSATGLYYGGHDWQTHTLNFVPKRTKARTFKRHSDASGHASWLAGVGAALIPTAPGWKEAYKPVEYDMRGTLSSSAPLPITADLIEIDKSTKEETVLQTGAEIAARIARRLALQRNVVARYGYGSTAAFDAAEQAERTDLDTLVLVYDPTGAIDVRAALKTAGVAGKKSIARKAAYDVYPPTPLITWSVAIPASAQDALLGALPPGTQTATLSFTDAVR